MHFAEPVLLNSKQSILDFLKSHQRCYTMSSWNQCSSFARKVRVISEVANTQEPA